MQIMKSSIMDMLNLRGLIQYSIKNAYNSYNNKNPTTNLIFKRAKDRSAFNIMLKCKNISADMIALFLPEMK